MRNRLNPKLSESEKKLFEVLLHLVIDILEDRKINMEGDNDVNDMYNWFLACREGRSLSVITDGETMRQDNQECDSLMLKLREHMLLHKWQDAMKVLETLSKSPLCKSHYVLLKLGLEIIYRLKCGSQTFDNLAEFVKNEASNGMEEILIDLFNFKLISRLPDGIRKQNGGSVVMEDVSELLDVKIKTGKTKFKPKFPIEVASETLHDYYYPGLIAYVKWNVARLRLETQESREEGYADELKKEAERAVNYFLECEKYDGVWDIMVAKHVEILEHHSVIEKNHDHVEAAKHVLEDYEKSYPNNPNALRMLYKFYKRHPKYSEFATKVLLKISKKLPSDILVLELVSSDIKEVGFSRLELLFELLDHHVWKNATELWSRLAGQLVEGLTDGAKKDDSMKTLKACWEFRRDWWPEYHFQEWSGFACVALDLYKASVAVILLGKKCKFYRKIVLASKEQSVTSEGFELLKMARKLASNVSSDLINE